jgi:uncharacterized RDD family membrane protein YckC
VGSGLNTMTSAQLEIHPLDESSAETEATPFALREQVAERLAAHRSRRTRPSGPSVTPIATATPAKTRAARIAAAVTERYAHSQSYRDFLAAEAERAIHEAQAAAEVAALNAQAVAEAQNQLLFELDQLTAEASAPSPEPAFQANPPAATAAIPQDGLSIRFSEEIDRNPAPLARVRLAHTQQLLDEDEACTLDEEIAFRQSPTFEEPAAEISANLIEFPRQLVAARKARPRLAEGPLREDADHTLDAAQLRIFEVEAAQISSAPAIESAAPEWSSILLSALPTTVPVATPEAPLATVHVPQTAPFSLRLMAGIVDSCIIAAALLAFIAAAGITVQKLAGPATAPMTPQLAIISAVGAFLILALAYQLLFFTFSESTPGMRYARIALCTLDDDNPTRSDMRRRIFASILAACPLGIGYLWACLDEDSLGWHDRISRMYQRSY